MGPWGCSEKSNLFCSPPTEWHTGCGTAFCHVDILGLRWSMTPGGVWRLWWALCDEDTSLVLLCPPPLPVDMNYESESSQRHLRIVRGQSSCSCRILGLSGNMNGTRNEATSSWPLNPSPLWLWRIAFPYEGWINNNLYMVILEKWAWRFVLWGPRMIDSSCSRNELINSTLQKAATNM